MVRLTLRTATSPVTGVPSLMASRAMVMRWWSRAFSSPWSWVVVLRRAEPSGLSTSVKIGDRSRPAAFQWLTARLASIAETWPIASSMLRKPERSQVLADLLGDVLEEGLDELGLAGEPRAQLGVLGGDADRAGVEVADAHHDAAADDERGRGEAELLGAEQRGDDDVATGLELAVALDDDPVAQPVEHQGLLGLGEADLPGSAGVLERGERRGAGAAVVAGDEHDVGVRLGDAGGDGADADLGDQLDVDPGLGVGVLEVVDQLGEVLDRVDVVVRRRADQADTGRRVPGRGDPRVDLVTGQLAALTGLGALRHLDLDVAGLGEVERRDTEATGGDLLDRRAALGVHQAVDVLATLAGVGATAEPVHRDGERLVGFLADRAVGHRAGVEPLDDLADRLDLVDRDRAGAATAPPRVNSPRSVISRSDCSSMREVYCLKMS